jgi:hypothetical protein
MIQFLSRPWCHFIALGLVLYIGQYALRPGPADVVQAPGAERVAELRAQWLRNAGRLPTAVQLQALIDDDIDQQMLFQEAIKRGWHQTDSVVRQRLVRDMRFLNPDTDDSDNALVEQALALQLHHNDVVVKRRLIQMMTLVIQSTADNVPSPASLSALYEQFKTEQPERILRPATLHLQHHFLQNDLHGNVFETAQQQLVALQQGGPVAADFFLHGAKFEHVTQAQTGRYFGADFAQAVFQTAANRTSHEQWFGPLPSVYGWHLVKLSAYRPASEKSLVELQAQLTTFWQRQQQQKQLQQSLLALRQQYEVRL